MLALAHALARNQGQCWANFLEVNKAPSAHWLASADRVCHMLPDQAPALGCPVHSLSRFLPPVRVLLTPYCGSPATVSARAMRHPTLYSSTKFEAVVLRSVAIITRFFSGLVYCCDQPALFVFTWKLGVALRWYCNWRVGITGQPHKVNMRDTE